MTAPDAPTVLTAPLTLDQIRAQAVPPGDGYVAGVYRMQLSDFSDNDLEEILDLVGMTLAGSELLMNPSYVPVGVDPDGTLLVRLSGDPAEILAMADEDAAR